MLVAFDRSTLTRDVQPLNALLSTLVAFGKSAFASEQPLNAPLPIFVVMGRFTYSSALQLANTLAPILVTFGKFALISALQPLNALPSTIVAFGKFTLVKYVEFWNKYFLTLFAPLFTSVIVPSISASNSPPVEPPSLTLTETLENQSDP